MIVIGLPKHCTWTAFGNSLCTTIQCDVHISFALSKQSRNPTSGREMISLIRPKHNCSDSLYKSQTCPPATAVLKLLLAPYRPHHRNSTYMFNVVSPRINSAERFFQVLRGSKDNECHCEDCNDCL